MTTNGSKRINGTADDHSDDRPHPLQVFHPQAFAGRRYLITGGSRGIGESTVRMLLTLGASVAAVARDPVQLSKLDQELGEKHDLLTISADVADDAALQDAVEQCRRRWGDELHGLVNNAMAASHGKLPQLSDDRFQQAWDVNVLGPYRLARYCLPLLTNAARTGRSASILNVSSVMAAQTRSGHLAYASSKGGLEALTRGLAVELAPRRIRVNTVVPGYIRTYEGHPGRELPKSEWTESMHLAAEYIDRLTAGSQPWPMHGRPEDCAAAIIYLLSDAAAFITGASLAVDGGFLVDFRHPQDQADRPELASLSELERRVSAAAERERQTPVAATGRDTH